MAADIVKAAQNAIVSTSDEQRFAEKVKGEIVAGAGRLMNVADNLPSCREERFLLFFKGFRAVIQMCGKGGCVGDIQIDMNVRHEDDR